jgi:predicted nuclease of predicted toxin-antitoxin system
LKLCDFPFLTDENIHPAVIAELRASGHDVFDVCENGLMGSHDTVLLKLANSMHRVVITHDRDFGALSIARMEPIVGVVFLRPGHINPQFTIESLRLLFSRDLDLAPPFLLIAKRTGNSVTIRVRNL